MKESELYIQFLRRNFVFLILPIILCIIASVYLFALVPTKVKISQTFKMNYDLSNIDTMLALTDQAVAELRDQRFATVFSESSVSIYKSAPLSIVIEATSLNRDNSYALLLKEIGYLRQNFSTEELTSPEIILVEPSPVKYLISGLIVGGLIGLLLSLIREYLKNY